MPKTNDLISDKESGGLTDTTKNLIQRTLDERSCGEKSEGKYCCAEEPVAQVNETECACGKSERSLQMIAGGNGEAIGKWPWMANIGYNSTKWKTKCGATVITNNTLLTAAHCFENGKWNNMVVLVGDNVINETHDNEHAKGYHIDHVLFHPSYEGNAYFDVAVIFTKETIEFNPKVQPICLPDKPVDYSDNREGDLVTITGWGLQKLRTMRKDWSLREAQVSVFSQKYCNFKHNIKGGSFGALIAKDLPDLFTSKIICAGSETGLAGTCSGDSGGPMVRFMSSADPPRYMQIGVLFGGVGQCGNKDFPNIYARLEDEEILNWIKVNAGIKTPGTAIIDIPNVFTTEAISNILLLAGGSGAGKNVELMQISPKQTKRCKDWPQLKGDPSDVLGGLLKNEPVLCHPGQKKCYWAHSQRLTRTNGLMGLADWAIDSTAVNINRNELYIAGGYSHNGLLKSSEVHTFDTETKVGPDLPFATSDQCMIQFRYNQFMLIGYDKAVINNRYFIYDLSRQQWLPELRGSYLPKGGTTKQHCAAFKTGGRTKIFLSGYAYNTNLYDVSSKKWERGPRLPVERSSYTMVANPAGDGILMLGGFQNGSYSKEVFQMKCQNDGIKTSCHWTRFPNDLPTVRSGFTAFYVPEKAMSCDDI